MSRVPRSLQRIPRALPGSLRGARGWLPGLPPDLRRVARLVLLAWLVSLLPVGGWIQFGALLPLVLLLPGYAIAAALFPTRDLAPEETVVYSIGLSICAVATGGVALQLVAPLNETTWPLLLAGIALVAVAVAARRRRAASAAGSAAPRAPRRTRGIGAPATALLLLALAIAAWSVELATDGANEQAAEARFSSLWIVPDRDADSGATIGVENEEGGEVSYGVVAWTGSSEAGRWNVELADGEEWQQELPAAAVSPTEPTAVEIWRDGELYRRAYLRPGTAL
jgi:uncharacterized membrane protein